MSNPCTTIQDKAADYVLGLLRQEDVDVFETHLRQCHYCREYTRSLEDEKRLLVQFGALLDSAMDARQAKVIEASHKTFSEQTKPCSIWKTIMRSRITQLAAAAVIVVAGVIGIDHLASSLHGAGVAWGNVIQTLQQVQTFTCHGTTHARGMEILGVPQEATSMIYNSSFLGRRRVETYVGQKEFTREFWVSDTNEVLVMVPQAEVYVRKILLSEDGFDPTITQDPYTFLVHFMSFEHTALGRRKINGIVAEGIEVNDPLLCLNAFEKMTARLWVDVVSNLPVLFEIDGSADVGRIRQTAVFDRFEWSVPLEADLFEPDIPDDYVSLGEIVLDGASEAMAIEGLRSFARCTDGQYPSRMVLVVAWKEILHAWQASINWEPRPPTQEERQHNQSILSTCLFYAGLEKQDRDPAYYGSSITVHDDAVLMRWKVSRDEYRVVFGNLTVKNVSADQLAALENSPVFDAVMQRPRKTMKVQGALGIDVSNWPAIQVIPELPAAKAGLQNGDVIVSVNGRDVSGITTPADALALLRGPAGETLTVRVGRDEQVLDFSVERVPLSK